MVLIIGIGEYKNDDKMEVSSSLLTKIDDNKKRLQSLFETQYNYQVLSTPLLHGKGCYTGDIFENKFINALQTKPHEYQK